MKKIYFTLLLLIFVLPAGFAQKGFHLGGEGGYNATFIVYQQTYGETELDYALTTGGFGGLVAGYNFDNHFGLQVEGLFAGQGQNYSKEMVNEPTTYREVKLSYFHIPFLFKYSCGAQYPTRFYLLAGPQLGILNSATIHYKDGGTEYTIDAKNRFTKNDWELVFELGSDFTITQGLYASTGLRFNYGLTDINDPAYRIPNHNGIYNASLNALGGINVGLHYVFGSH